MVGKAHIQHGTSRESIIPFSQLPVADDPYPAGWDTLENYEQYLNSAEPVKDFYGFQHAEFTLGHGDLITGHHYRWAIDKGLDPETALLEWPTADRPVSNQSKHWWQVYQASCDEEYYSTTFVTERSCDWISKQTQDKPWFFQCSFPDPHHPFTPPGDWGTRHKPCDMPVSNTLYDPLTNAPSHVKVLHGLSPSDTNIVQMFGPTEDQLKDAMAAEFGMIEYIDESIGKVLDCVEASGHKDNTIVIFTSDHGDMFGDHGLMLKGLLHYEGCTRVPFVVSGAGITPGVTNSLASSLDIAQTILDLTQTEELDHMQGVSLTPLLEDVNAVVRDHVYIEEDMPPFERARIPHKARTLVTKEARMSSYSTGETEVYDRMADPDELNNLAVTDPSSTLVSTMQKKMITHLLNYTDMARLSQK